MYDLLTSAVLFFALVPGVLLTLPPGGGISAALVHAVVFYVVQRYVASYVPWWGIWIVAAVAILLKVFSNPSAPTSGGRR